jgi:hypothetical protein
MTNTKLIFLSGIENHNTELECFSNVSDAITISITDVDGDHQFNKQFVSLDIPTAIKLAKVLRTEINKIKEVTND